MLVDSYNLFLTSASRIPNFIPGTKEEVDDIQTLANGYIKALDNNEQDKMDSYISALMIRYWYMIPYLYTRSISLRVSEEEMIDWLYDAFMKAFKNRKWLDVNDKLYKDKKGAQKAIEKSIDCVRYTNYQLANYDVRKVNYIAGSLENSQELFGDAAEEFLVEDDCTSSLDVSLLVANKIKTGKLLSALIIDCICFGDCFTKTKFSVSKLVSNFNQNYFIKFITRYNLRDEDIAKLGQILKLKRQKLVYNIKRELEDLSKDKSIGGLYAK